MAHPAGRLRVVVLMLVVVSLLLVGCEDGLDTLQETRDQAEETAQLARFCASAVQLGNAVRQQDEQAIVDAAETAAANAPDDIASDAERARDGARQLADGDRSVLEDEGFQRSVEAVATYSRERCDPTN